MTDEELRNAANALMNHAESDQSRDAGTVTVARLFAHRLGGAVLKMLPPADVAEPVTADWLLAVGGERLEDTVKPYGDPSNPNHRFPKVRFGPFVWYTNLWASEGGDRYTATYFLKYSRACLGSSPELTRDRFRHLCAGLGIKLKETK